MGKIIEDFDALPVGGTLKITKYAHELAAQVGFDKQFTYTLASIVAKGYPGAKMNRGSNGGFTKFANSESAAEAHMKAIDSMLGDVIPEQEIVEPIEE
jgi:hypothetical protein